MGEKRGGSVWYSNLSAILIPFFGSYEGWEVLLMGKGGVVLSGTAIFLLY